MSTRTLITALKNGQALPDSRRSAVSLHSHTLYSREMLAVVPRAMRKATFYGWRTRHGGRTFGDKLDFERLWWTPPLSPRQSLQLERTQIENRLGKHPLVALTDHDSIDAPMMLRVLSAGQEVPISVEWTVPYDRTFFHFGIHNLPLKHAREIFASMQSYTARPDERTLDELLTTLSENPAILIVFNHPLWDEKGLGKREHWRSAAAFLDRYKGRVHALEWNGFRPEENPDVVNLGAAYGLPVVGGGDRHGAEPSSVLNLTNAGTFEEFVSEIRNDGHSDVLLMPQQHESIALRVVRTICDVVRDDPNHGLGWTSWADRVFYRCDDGQARSLNEISESGRVPVVLNRMVGSVHVLDRFLAHPRLRSVLGWRPVEE